METIRVGVTLLDRLMNLLGELVLARNQLLQFSNSTQDAGFQAVSQRTNLISRKITAIQTDTQGAVEAIGTITGVISQINDISGTIATALEEQSATTNGEVGVAGAGVRLRANSHPRLRRDRSGGLPYGGQP